MNAHADVAIVGGGPVGLYLALALLKEGLRPRVYERAVGQRSEGSRSIGIHPPSLELFDEIGVAAAFLARGVKVRRGFAFGDRGPVGEVSFDRCPGPHRFVLTIVLSVRGADGALARPSFGAVIGADGKRSVVRAAMGIGFEGSRYAGEYAMADGPETTPLGDAAAVFLSRSGLVESFPLPDQRRRWVVRRGDDAGSPPTRAELARLVAARARISLAVDGLTAPSAFRAERRLASRFAKGRVALAGDAAHIVSPIGGQGMNLGWLGARSLARVLGAELSARRDPSAALARDGRERRAIAGTVARRAELNMWLGAPTAHGQLRDAVLGAVLALPTAGLLAQAFTMRSLALGV